MSSALVRKQWLTVELGRPTADCYMPEEWWQRKLDRPALIDARVILLEPTSRGDDGRRCQAPDGCPSWGTTGLCRWDSSMSDAVHTEVTDRVTKQHVSSDSIGYAGKTRFFGLQILRAQRPGLHFRPLIGGIGAHSYDLFGMSEVHVTR